MTAILQLQWNQVDFRHETINFNCRATVPINDRAYDALQEAVSGALTNYVIEWDGKRVKSAKKAIRKAAERSGVQCSPMSRHAEDFAVWQVLDAFL